MESFKSKLKTSHHPPGQIHNSENENCELEGKNLNFFMSTEACKSNF